MENAPSAGPADIAEVVDVCKDLVLAANAVVKAWETGDLLASAVNNLRLAADFAEYTVDSVK